jgi:membrane protein required for colicin V production
VQFNYLDMFFILLIVAAAVRGALKGFVAELASVAALVLGIWGAVAFSGHLLPALQKYLGDSLWNRLIAFLIIFLAIYIAVKLAELLLHRLFENLNLFRLDQVLGFFLGAGEGLLATVLLLYLLRWQPLLDTRHLLADSFFARLLLPLVFSGEPLLRMEALFSHV